MWITSIGNHGSAGGISECRHSSYTPRTTKLLGGYIGFTPSVRLSVRPSRIPCPLCSFYSSGWIHFIFMHLIRQLQKVCRMQSFLQNFKIWNFGNLKKNCNFDFMLFWLGIWCESLVWVIMGRRGVSQNAGVLVVLVMPPAQRSCWGGILVSLRPSVCPSVRPASAPRPSRIPCPLCSFYSSGWIHFIFMHLIKQLQKVCRVQSFLQNSKIWNFGNFKKKL